MCDGHLPVVLKRQAEEVAKIHPQASAVHHDRNYLVFMSVNNAAHGRLRAPVEIRAVLGASGGPVRIVPMLLPLCGIRHEVVQSLTFPSPVAALA